MFVTALLAVALAAPIPKATDKQKIEKWYGKMVDPKGDSTFALDRGKLVVTLPANEMRSIGYSINRQDLDEEKGPRQFTTAPRVEFAAKGDVTVTVRIGLDLDPKAKADGGAYAPYVGAGVGMMVADPACFAFGAIQIKAEDGTEGRYWSETPGPSTLGIVPWSAGPKELPKELWVRLERSGAELVYGTSADGKTFNRIRSVKPKKLEEEMTFALFAHHASDKAHAVTFDQLAIEGPKAKRNRDLTPGPSPK